ncbi:hypothetical protein FRB90_000618 [Tulasnella sp. 427]|nr:hypothetical protein FRB90_000618 [Tulasnella sp. 427]
MTSIASLPPELFHQVFHWATYDNALFEDRPSWRNYDLDKYDGEDPWPQPSQEAERTARSLTSTCKYWRVLATEFELRHITVSELRQLDFYVERIRKFSQPGEHSAEFPVRWITLNLFKVRVWMEEDTTRLVALVRVCPSLEVLINRVSADGALDLELQGLRCLQLNVNQDYFPLVHVVAELWKLPSLTSLYLKSTRYPTLEGIDNLVKLHGARLETLAMDESTSKEVPLPFLPPSPVQDLMFHGEYGVDIETATFPSLSTLAVRFEPMEPFVISRFILTTLRALRSVLDHTQLKEIIVLEPHVENLDKPHPWNGNV